MHGGLVMAFADEVAAWSVIGAIGRFGFTTKVEGRLRSAVKTGIPLVGEGRVEGEPTRVAQVEVRLSQQDQTCFEGSFRFAILGKDAAEKLLGGPLPEAWLKFAR